MDGLTYIKIHRSDAIRLLTLSDYDAGEVIKSACAKLIYDEEPRTLSQRAQMVYDHLDSWMEWAAAWVKAKSASTERIEGVSDGKEEKEL